MYGILDVARLLIGEGAADVHQATNDGRTPLYTSCGNGRLDVARLLLETDTFGRGARKSRERIGFDGRK